jgi:hypothetical protein
MSRDFAIYGRERMRGPGPANVGGGAPTWTKKAGPAIQDEAFGSTSSTFTAQPINNASSSDTIIVTVSNSQRETAGVTIDGNAMTLVVASHAGSNQTSIWKYTGAVLTTANIVVSSALALGQVGISVGVLTGVNAAETDTAVKPFAFSANPQETSTSLTVPASGFGIVVYCQADVGNVTPNVGFEDYDTGGAFFTHWSGYMTASDTPSVNGQASVGQSMAAAAWGP